MECEQKLDNGQSNSSPYLLIIIIFLQYFLAIKTSSEGGLNKLKPDRY